MLPIVHGYDNPKEPAYFRIVFHLPTYVGYRSIRTGSSACAQSSSPKNDRSPRTPIASICSVMARALGARATWLRGRRACRHAPRRNPPPARLGPDKTTAPPAGIAEVQFGRLDQLIGYVREPRFKQCRLSGDLQHADPVTHRFDRNAHSPLSRTGDHRSGEMRRQTSNGPFSISREVHTITAT